MKRVECIIRPSKLKEVREALQQMGVHGLTITEVRGCAKQGGYTDVFMGREYNIPLLPKVKIEVVLADSEVEKVVEVVTRAARTDNIGDGKIFVFPVEEVVRIRTGERGAMAI